jgi:hypothetical protein
MALYFGQVLQQAVAILELLQYVFGDWLIDMT